MYSQIHVGVNMQHPHARISLNGLMRRSLSREGQVNRPLGDSLGLTGSFTSAAEGSLLDLVSKY